MAQSLFTWIQTTVGLRKSADHVTFHMPILRSLRLLSQTMPWTSCPDSTVTQPLQGTVSEASDRVVLIVVDVRTAHEMKLSIFLGPLMGLVKAIWLWSRSWELGRIHFAGMIVEWFSSAFEWSEGEWSVSLCKVSV